MYVPKDKSDTIWVYDVEKECYIYKFPTKLDAMKFLASYQSYDSWNKVYCNYYLDNINMGNDIGLVGYINWRWSPRLQRDTSDGCYYTNRKFIFVDEFDRYVDFRLYMDEINELAKARNTQYECIGEVRKYPWWYNDYHFRYRKDPVPGTGTRRRRYCILRHIRTTNEKRLNADNEIRELVRPKRNLNNLPDLWDDIPRSCSRSWKDCTKKKKQWM